MIKITKEFSASENGIDVIEYEEGSLHKDLPPVALEHSKTIEATESLKGKELTAALKAIEDAEILAEEQE